ncbi:hypothetical protein BDV32DRAFT_120573 [Aspergillus pseudonomiae]|nr:hypothetical protein BDV32DRAFT_120573 [Aspergillus pseudonomiae]
MKNDKNLKRNSRRYLEFPGYGWRRSLEVVRTLTCQCCCDLIAFFSLSYSYFLFFSFSSFLFFLRYIRTVVGKYI